jgi:acetyltransferase-like isoleucine patch superfamily enzyme
LNQNKDEINHEWQKPTIFHGKLTKYNYIVYYPENLKMGSFFDIGTFSFLNCKHGIEIADYVQVGSHCAIYSDSTIDNKQGNVILQKNCKIGTHSTIMPNVTIGQNSIVAAHSFVNCDIPSNELWAGIPAKFKSKIILV